MNQQPDFTIKQISGNPMTGVFEHLWPAVGQVWKTPNMGGDGGDEFIPQAVRFHSPDGVPGSIDSGIVYVVNSNGKTVATYDLNAPPKAS